jgi:hypothetical protein
MACCYSKLGELESGLTVLRGLLELKISNVENLRCDPDLEELRGTREFNDLLQQFEQGTTVSSGPDPSTQNLRTQQTWVDQW